MRSFWKWNSDSLLQSETAPGIFEAVGGSFSIVERTRVCHIQAEILGDMLLMGASAEGFFIDLQQ